MNAYVASYLDDLLQTHAHTVSGSPAAADYPAAYLTDPNPAKPAKLAATSGDWVIEFDDEPAPAVGAAIIYQYLDPGLEVRIQGNDADDWGSPAFDQAIPIPPKRLDGPAYQRWTHSPAAAFSSPQSFQFWRLVVVGENSQDVIVGRLMLLSALRPVELIHDGDMSETDRPDDDPSQIVQSTELGVETIVTVGGPRRGLSFIWLATDLGAGTAPQQQAADFRALCQATDGRQNPFLLIPFSLQDAWLVRPETAAARRSHRQGGYQVWAISVREVSRGTPWP